MKKIRKVRYTGILAEPMVLQKTPSGLLSGPEGEKIKEWDEKANNLQQRIRVLALFEHYGLNPLSHEDWHRMVGALASDHVPGFQIIDGPAPRAGRPTKWQGDKQFELLADVWALMPKVKSANAACNILVNKPEYQKNGEKIDTKTLYRRYQEALKKYKQSDELSMFRILADNATARKGTAARLRVPARHGVALRRK